MTFITIVSRTGGQPDDVTVQTKEFISTESNETTEDGLVGSSKVPVPLKTVQSPVPKVVEPAKVVALAQMVWSGPAVIIGGLLTVMLTVSF